MTSLIFDTGPLISLTLNNLLWTVEKLRERFSGDFLITADVYHELIQKPLSTKKYKFEALQILPLITKGVIKVLDTPEIEARGLELTELANHIYKAHDNWINIVHRAEMQVLACCLVTGSDTIVIDERTTRILIESPRLLQAQLSKKLHTHVDTDPEALRRFAKEAGRVRVIRSFELVTIAYELGLLDRYAVKSDEPLVPDIHKALLEGVLWAVKLAGCSVRQEDIYEILESEK